MRFVSASLQHYRNLALVRVRFEGRRTFLLGANGQGKSNFLEALGYVTALRSFRGNELRNLPALGQPIHDRLIATPTMLIAAQGDANGEAATPAFGAEPTHTLRAYEKTSGRLLAEMELPAGAVGGMSTYQHDGRQYLVLPIGTRGRPSELIALTAP